MATLKMNVVTDPICHSVMGPNSGHVRTTRVPTELIADIISMILHHNGGGSSNSITAYRTGPHLVVGWLPALQRPLGAPASHRLRS